MHTNFPPRTPRAALFVLLFIAASCSENVVTGPRVERGRQSIAPSGVALGPAVRVSEIHYDNLGTDTGEAIEISGPAGTDLTGWTLVLYNGSGGAAYDTKPLSGTIPSVCDGRGVVVVSYPSNGIQNGSPDGFALVNASNQLVEFLSYEGTFSATDGPATGVTSTDIGVSEAGTEAASPVTSLKRSGADVWSGPAPNNFGACNDNDGGPPSPPPPPPPPVPGLPDTRFSEIHYDNALVDAGEAIEIEGPADTDLAGWSVALYNGNGGVVYNSRVLDGSIPALCSGRGVVVLDYPQDGIQNGSPDGFALIDAAGQVVEFLSYEGTLTATDGPAAGMTSKDIGVAETSTSPIGESLQRNAAGIWQGPAAASFGACNGSGTPPPPPGKNVTFSGRSSGDPPLPVGFEDQVFATLRDGSTAIPTGFTWTSEAPLIASVDRNGVIRALAAGIAVLRATAEDGTTGTYSLPTRAAVASTTAMYNGNAEFGEPSDANAVDDFIIRRPQFTSSYNLNRGTPNWVSYNLDASHFGTEDRCDCFTFDPELRDASFPAYTTADYTGAGSFHGYGIDRGHLARSFDRTSASLDNATSFYFTNIIPQAADNNQGPWSGMETYLGNLARLDNKEVYIIAGVAGDKGTIKNEGKIVIPASTWKVAVILPRDQGLSSINNYRDLDVVAAIMPNDPGIRSVNWETYRTTVDAVETLSGYNLLALLRDDIEIAVESGTRPPVAALDGPFTSNEGAAVMLSAAASSDADGDALTYDWTFGDGHRAGGASVTHTYAQDSAYTVRLIVTDIRGLADTVTTVATVSNVAPVIGTFGASPLLTGQTYTVSSSFADPGADSWSATVDYGDGWGPVPLRLEWNAFVLFHVYTRPGTFTVTVRVSDDDVTTTRTETVVVRAP